MRGLTVECRTSGSLIKPAELRRLPTSAATAKHAAEASGGGGSGGGSSGGAEKVTGSDGGEDGGAGAAGRLSLLRAFTVAFALLVTGDTRTSIVFNRLIMLLRNGMPLLVRVPDCAMCVLAAGGVIGYKKAGSRRSLVASVSVAAALLLSAYLMGTLPSFGLSIALGE